MWARSFVSKANFFSPREEYPSWVGDWDNKGSPPIPTMLLVWHFLTHPPHPASKRSPCQLASPQISFLFYGLRCKQKSGRRRGVKRKEKKKPTQYMKRLIQTADQSIPSENRATTLSEIDFLEAEPGLREVTRCKKRKPWSDWEASALLWPQARYGSWKSHFICSSHLTLCKTWELE